MTECHALRLQDKDLFLRHLHLRPPELSPYSFAAISIWKSLYEIKWRLEENTLYVFFQDDSGAFLYLPPLGPVQPGEVTRKVFEEMDEMGHHPEISRIENVPSCDVPLYQALGYECIEKDPDYVYLREDLVGLKGDRYKSQRGACNRFVKTHAFEVHPFVPKDASACLSLHDLWALERSSRTTDPVYQGMLKDSRQCLAILLEDMEALGCTARIVKVQGEVKAFTAGCRLSSSTFSILFEFSDLSLSGLAAFLFREFCRELDGVELINVMDASGLENLRRVKQSYHPVQLVPAFVVRRR